MRAVREWIDPGLLILAARTGFTRTEIINMNLKSFIRTVRAFIPK